MVKATFSLVKLILVTLGVVASTGMPARAAPVDTADAPDPAPARAFQPTDIIGILKCQIGCFRGQVESSGRPEVIAMYNNCHKQCGSDDNIQTLSCKITTCQHLGAAYRPPYAEGIYSIISTSV